MKKKHLIVRSRNKTCSPLRKIIVPHSTIYRMGSTTLTADIKTRDKEPWEINTAESCRLSGDKRLMKECFDRASVPTAEWFTCRSLSLKTFTSRLEEWGALIVKRYNSSKGNNIYLLKDVNDYESFVSHIKNNRDSFSNYVFEKYYTYTREYRIHVTREGCFYASRKMLKRDAEVRWHRHAENSIWYNEDNPEFNKPDNWDAIIRSCVKALIAMDLDIAAFDVKMQGSEVKNPSYILLESNSAPSLGEEGIKKYTQQLIKLIYG